MIVSAAKLQRANRNSNARHHWPRLPPPLGTLADTPAMLADAIELLCKRYRDAHLCTPMEHRGSRPDAVGIFVIAGRVIPVGVSDERIDFMLVKFRRNYLGCFDERADFAELRALLEEALPQDYQT